MSGIFKYKNNQPVNWFNSYLPKSNQYCLYCGSFFGDSSIIESDKEHLIAREFVPTGEFGEGKEFNFIFRACKKCNLEKSNLERHISTVTLFKSPARRESEEHNEIAIRKAGKDYHPDKKGSLVKDSGDDLKIVLNDSNIKMTFGLVGPPQENTDHVLLLAFRHIQGIFTLITSKNPLTADGTRLLVAEHFHLFGTYSHSDWGNPQLLAIMERVSNIPCYANILTANGFFRAIMRRNNGEKGEWFWALEWNKSLRLVGSIGLPVNTSKIFSDLPSLAWKYLGLQDGAKTRMREEIPIKEEQDNLFSADVK